MKKNLLVISILFLGVSMIISSIILSLSIKEGNQLYGSLSGSFSMNDYSGIDSDVLMPYDAERMLGYDQDALILDIENGTLEGIPFTQVGERYIFSKKALEEWIYSKTLD